ncbi:tyrosine-type recombinase/integrase [Mesorhizobium australicum]|uniref:tyrosine-type recombinase/integrase n=1 Tax=Mesorhizobium australicum TaxID=536018 RepID=UPI00333BA0AF
MPRENLTDNRLKALKPAAPGQRYVIMDAQVPAMGVRVTDKAPANGSKLKAGQVSFIYIARFGGAAQPARRTLGEYDVMSLDAARTKARQWAALIDRGIDPKVLAEDERQAAARAAAESRDRSFETILDRFIKARRRDRVRKVDEDERDFNRECLPKWKGRDVAGITMADIIEVVEGIAARGKQRQALNLAQKIGTFFNWCADGDVIEDSPYRPKRVTTDIGKKDMRSRVLSDEELRVFWSATDGTAEGIGNVYSAVYRLLLLTGQRLNDIAEASWSEIDMAKRVLVIPAARFKSDRDHVVPLTDDAVAIIEKLPRFKKCDWMCSLDGAAPATIGHKVKQRLDAAMLSKLKEQDPEATLPAWVNHDLRRTARTRLSRLKVLPDVAEMVIGHVLPKIVRNYVPDPFAYIDDKRDALARWEGSLAEIVGQPKASNVIPMAGRAAP